MEATLERKFVFTRIAAGDYLLPSNDAETIWRIRRYTDGPSMGLDIPRDREFWALWKWDGRVGIGGAVDIEDWNRWEMYEDSFGTRAEAIEVAMDVDR